MSAVCIHPRRGSARPGRLPTLTTALLLAALVTGTHPTAAATIAYVVPDGTVGEQAFGGALGMDFDVTSPVQISQLGVFDSGQDGLARGIMATLYDRATQTEIASVSFTESDPGVLQGGSRFKPLQQPIRLPTGFQGTIVAAGYGSGEPNGNSGSPSWSTDPGVGDLLSFVGSARWGSDAGLFPPNTDGGPANRYAAGTFVFRSAVGAPIVLPNFSFEEPVYASDGDFGPAAGWNGTSAGAWNPPATQLAPSQGSQVAYVNQGNQLQSDPLSASLRDGTLYILEADWGRRTAYPNANHIMALLAGDTVLGYVNNSTVGNGPVPAVGEMTTARGYFTTNHDAASGAPLSILFGAANGQANYDNVHLFKIENAAVPVANHSFEEPALSGEYQQGAPDWIQGGNAGIFERPEHITPADGLQTAYTTDGASLTQILDGQGNRSILHLEPNTRYILMVEVGRRNNIDFGGYLVELLAGDTALALDDGTLGVPIPGEFVTTSVIDFFAAPDDPALAGLFGRNVGIRLTNPGAPSPSGQTMYDNVRLFAYAVPEPSSVVLLGIGAAGALLAVVRRRQPRAAM